ncbi:glycoside hydrolase family 3 protein [Selenomonas sp.]|uniref:glycoside hydrolase family 3 protein n=1 Tax=Selenomonas sp. TaxID=2053611 RepID=UPI003FA3254D
MMKNRANRNASLVPLLLCLTIFCASLLFAGCLARSDDAASKDAAASRTPKSLSPDEKAAAIVQKMSDAEKVGQLLMIGIQGTELDDDSRFMLSEYHIGGVILFDRNMKSQEQVRALNDSLQKNASDAGLPLFLAIDEEGGAVARMKEAFPPPPAAAEIGRTGDPKAAYRYAADTAHGLKAMGFNLNFAPVADLGAADRRSYADDAATVTRFVAAALEGHADVGLLATIKHFPGLGRGESDTHEDTVAVYADRATLEASDLVPFREMIAKRNAAKNAKGASGWFVMATHTMYPALDAEHPASLSPAILQKLLREELSYDGVIVTDDLEMGAISRHYGFDRAGVEAILAGADLVLVCHDYAHETAVYNGILKAVKSGEISKDRLDASVRRIVKAKIEYLE